MLRKDFILVQIEELAKVIAQIIHLRNTNAPRKIPVLVQTIYDSLKIDQVYLLAHTPEQIFDLLNQVDSGGFERMEIAAKLLIEESFVHPDLKSELLQKAKEMLTYLQQHSNTFSLERCELINQLDEY